MSEKNEVIKYEIIDDLPDENRTISQLEAITTFQKVIQKNLIKGHDYGQAFSGHNGKPSLLKSGAEKIIMLMGLRAIFKTDKEIEDHKNGYFFYKIKCQLIKNGEVITEGFGSCNSEEDKYTLKPKRRKDGAVYWEPTMEDQRRYKFTIANTVLKMAKKRAMVDAVLIVASLSNIFTQDMEDFDYSTTHTHTQYNKKPAKKEIKDNHKVFGALKSELIKNPEVSEGLVSMLSKDKNFENYLYKKLKFNSRLQNEAWKVFYDVKDKKGKYQTIIETIENLYESYIEEHADEAIAEATGDMA